MGSDRRKTAKLGGHGRGKRRNGRRGRGSSREGRKGRKRGEGVKGIVCGKLHCFV
jgi:hypothetical protein